MIYSFSRLNLYSQCPFRFRLKYIEGREEPVTKPLALGKGVHKGIEEMIEHKVSLEQAATTGLIEADFHPEVTYDEIVKLIDKAPITYFDGLDVNTELHFELPLSASASAPRLQGYIDLVFDDSGSFIDWKTHWKPYDVWGNMQIPLYAWVMMQIKDVSTVGGMLWFLRFKKRYTHTFNKDEGEIARKWAYDLAMKIEERMFLAEIMPEEIDRLFPATPSSTCKHCPFSLECYQKFVRPQQLGAD